MQLIWCSMCSLGYFSWLLGELLCRYYGVLDGHLDILSGFQEFTMQLQSHDVLGGQAILGCCQGVAMQLLCYSRCSLRWLLGSCYAFTMVFQVASWVFQLVAGELLLCYRCSLGHFINLLSHLRFHVSQITLFILTC